MRIRAAVEFMWDQVHEVTWTTELPDEAWDVLDAGRVERKGDLLILPSDQFAWANRVADAVVGHCNSVRMAFEPPKFGSQMKPNSVVFVLESPHRDEYHVHWNGKLLPLDPLCDKATRRYFLRHVYNVVQGLPFTGSNDVILVNPIPWQTSLARLYGVGMQTSVRDEVWRRIWNYEVCGRKPAQQEFLTRLALYRPAAVINSCTEGLQADLGRVLQGTKIGAGWHMGHPASWRRNDTPKMKPGWF